MRISHAGHSMAPQPAGDMQLPSGNDSISSSGNANAGDGSCSHGTRAQQRAVSFNHTRFQPYHVQMSRNPANLPVTGWNEAASTYNAAQFNPHAVQVPVPQQLQAYKSSRQMQSHELQIRPTNYSHLQTYQEHQQQQQLQLQQLQRIARQQDAQLQNEQNNVFDMGSYGKTADGYPQGLIVGSHGTGLCIQTTCDTQSCPRRKEEVAASVLISLHGGEQGPLEDDPHQCCHSIPQEILGQRSFSVEQVFALNHIMACHPEEQPGQCQQPCPAESPAVFQECYVPRQFSATLDQSVLENSGVDDLLCGFRAQVPTQYIEHFNQVHRPVLPIAHEHHTSMLDPVSNAPGVTSNISNSNSAPMTTVTTPPSTQPSTSSSPLNGSDWQSLSPVESASFECLWNVTKGVECRQRFRDGEKLQHHIQDVHLQFLKRVEEDGGYNCEWSNCDRTRSFAQKSKVARHMQTHTGFKSEVCPECGLRLSAKQSLNQHLLIHSDSRPWACDFPGCGLNFRQQSALTMHRRTHTGEKPLICEICGKAFSESSNLSKHRKTHKEEQPLKCPYEDCGRPFRRQDQLKRHIDSHQRRQAKQDAISSQLDEGDAANSSRSPTLNARQKAGRQS